MPASGPMAGPPPEAFDFEAERARMVRRDLAGRDITDPRVLEAMGRVPRERFVPPVDWDEAYADHPVGIASGQTISQPYIVAYMTQSLRLEPGMTVLEIGTGSGYQAAILAAMGVTVLSVERHEALARGAAEALAAAGLAEGVTIHLGDGTLGWPERAPYDRVIVTAAAPHVPAALKQQLAHGGRLVAPVGKGSQVLTIVDRVGESFRETRAIAVVFVPLIGEDGF